MKRLTILLMILTGCSSSTRERRTIVPNTSDPAGVLRDEALASESAAMARLVERVRPSVVTVDVTSSLHTEVDYFRSGGKAKETPGRRPLRRRRDGTFHADGAGSGVVYGEGLVLTNAHVVAGASDVKVSQDDETWDAEIAGVDPLADVAVLRVRSLTLKPAAVGDSDALKIGEWILALGDPYIFKRSVTFGIVSSKGRSDIGIARYEDFVQVDCAINPGNSGGALVNMKGEIVGINTAYYSDGAGFSGIGLAIPINQAVEIAKRLEKDGRVHRGSLGVEVQDLNGIVVKESENETFEPGDVLLSIGDKPLRTVRDYYSAVGKLSPGAAAKVKRKRGRKEEEIEFTLVEQSIPDFGRDSWSSPTLGLAVQELTPWLARELGRAGEKGVIVSRVDSELMPELKVGDVILRVGAKKVASVKEFEALADVDEPGDFYISRARGGHVFVSPPK